MPSLMQAVKDGKPSPKSPLRRNRNENFKVAMPWFNTAIQATSPDAADTYWQQPRPDWGMHRWDSLESYTKAKSLAIRREIADTERDTKKLIEISNAMQSWKATGAQQARVFLQKYNRPETHVEGADIDSMDLQAQLINAASAAVHNRRKRLEREQQLLVGLPSQIEDRKVTEVPSLRILTPRIHSVWEHGQSVSITWVSTGALDKVTIKLGSQLGTWHTIAETVENTGQFTWTVKSELPPSKWYHLQITGYRDARNITTATTPFFALNEAKSSKPTSNQAVEEADSPNPSPFKRHATRQVCFPTLSKSILLERFDPWEDADPNELLLDELPVLSRPPQTCALDFRSPVDAIMLPSGHAICFANGMEALKNPETASEISSVIRLYHTPDHLTGIAPRGDPATWHSLSSPGEPLQPSPGRLRDSFRNAQIPADQHLLSPKDVPNGRMKAESMRVWASPKLTASSSPVQALHFGKSKNWAI